MRRSPLSQEAADDDATQRSLAAAALAARPRAATEPGGIATRSFRKDKSARKAPQKMQVIEAGEAPVEAQLLDTGFTASADSSPDAMRSGSPGQRSSPNSSSFRRRNGTIAGPQRSNSFNAGKAGEESGRPPSPSKAGDVPEPGRPGSPSLELRRRVSINTATTDYAAAGAAAVSHDAPTPPSAEGAPLRARSKSLRSEVVSSLAGLAVTTPASPARPAEAWGAAGNDGTSAAVPPPEASPASSAASSSTISAEEVEARKKKFRQRRLSKDDFNVEAMEASAKAVEEEKAAEEKAAAAAAAEGAGQDAKTKKFRQRRLSKDLLGTPEGTTMLEAAAEAEKAAAANKVATEAAAAAAAAAASPASGVSRRSTPDIGEVEGYDSEGEGSLDDSDDDPMVETVSLADVEKHAKATSPKRKNSLKKSPPKDATPSTGEKAAAAAKAAWGEGGEADVAEAAKAARARATAAAKAATAALSALSAAKAAYKAAAADLDQAEAEALALERAAAEAKGAKAPPKVPPLDTAAKPRPGSAPSGRTESPLTPSPNGITRALTSSKNLLAQRPVTIAAEMEEDGASKTKPTFDPATVGTYSCHGQEPGPQGGVGKINQDCACLAHPFSSRQESALVCVFDGHGKHGEDVSQEVLHAIHEELYHRADALLAKPGATLAATFEEVNRHLQRLADAKPMQIDALDSGACACVAFLNERDLWVAGVGDCRAVLATQENGVMTPVALSTDHKVNLPEEQARIEGMGGYVQPEEEDDGDFMPARMYESALNRRLGPGLCVSRALGDLKALKIGLLPTPEVCTHTVSDDDCFLIMASDGVWEFIDNAEAVQIVNQFYSAGRPAMDACRFLIAKAAVLWRKYEGDYRDDITAVVMYLPPVMRILNSEAK